MLIRMLLEEHMQVINKLRTECFADIEEFSRLAIQTLQSQNTIFFMGNGGSAADAQHLAAEFVGRFQKERRGFPSIALTTDSSILTAVGNDYGFEHIFERQIQALVRPGDLVVGISTSGNSPNVVAALVKAKKMGAATIGLTGENGGAMSGLCDICVKVPSTVTARIQEAHILIGHIVCAVTDGVE